MDTGNDQIESNVSPALQCMHNAYMHNTYKI